VVRARTIEIIALTPTKFWSRNYGPPEIEADEQV
jgi:hypothetical protein